MSASGRQRAEWLAPDFWEQLDLLEERHRQVQLEHNSARRGIERLTRQQGEELRQAWQRYCEVIAELERVTAEFEALRVCAN
jgi:hypothetical protein